MGATTSYGLCDKTLCPTEDTGCNSCQAMNTCKVMSAVVLALIWAVFLTVTYGWKAVHSTTLSYPFAQIQHFKFPVVLVFMQYLVDAYSALWITVYHVFPQKCCQPWPHERSNAMLVKCTFLLHVISYKPTCLTADRLRVLQPLWSIYCSLSLSIVESPLPNWQVIAWHFV